MHKHQNSARTWTSEQQEMHVNTFITDLNQLTPQWLTHTLRGANALPQGEVISVSHSDNPTRNSLVTHLTLAYSNSAPPAAPVYLLLKRNRPQAWSIEVGASEVAFYNLIATLPDHPPIIVPCYAAAYDAASGNSSLLMRDLSSTHKSPLTRDQHLRVGENIPPSHLLSQTIDTLARFHAYWWQHPLLGTGATAIGHWYRDQAHFNTYIQRRRASWQNLLAAESLWFPADLRHLYQQTIDNLPILWNRHFAPRFSSLSNMTLIHGDAYFNNFLCPIDPTQNNSYLIDWQSPEVHLGPSDLINLCATFWTRAQRHTNHLEERILLRYLDVLYANGVSNYSWRQLLTDYRLELIEWFLIPLQDRNDGSPKDYWWPKMQCLASAFQDWHCLDLLTP